MGKTVLLNRFYELARDEGLRVGFVEAPESGDIRRLLATRLRAILLDLDRGAVSKVVTRALGTLKSFAYTLPDGSAVSIDVDAVIGRADSGMLSEDVTDLLVATGEAARERGTGVLLAYSERLFEFPQIDSLGREDARAAPEAQQQLDQNFFLVRSALIRKGMVYSPAHGETAFTVPLFDDFLRRTSVS